MPVRSQITLNSHARFFCSPRMVAAQAVQINDERSAEEQQDHRHHYHFDTINHWPRGLP